MEAFDIEAWLNAHSIRHEQVGGELVFTHKNDGTSVLLPADISKQGSIHPALEAMAPFYHRFSGASIGGSHIMIATNVCGGLVVSHGYRLLDLKEMAEQARALGLTIPDSECVFLAEAAYMFFYTLSVEAGKTVLRQYDRDFQDVRIVHNLKEVFDQWWEIVCADM